MAQSSTNIASTISHKASSIGTVISFIASEKKIKSSDTASVIFNYSQYDLLTITGSSSNNSTFTVKSVASDNSYVIVEETITDESAGASITVDYTGFVTAKYQGDGYYSQVDGVHTVAYHVNNVMTGSVKMQGSLATDPTEDDWFDISGTTFTTNQSTLVSSYNFTGNFVWVRAKCTDMTAGTLNKILYNH